MNMSHLDAANAMNMGIYTENSQRTKWKETSKSPQIKILRVSPRSRAKGKVGSGSKKRLMRIVNQSKMVSRSQKKKLKIKEQTRNRRSLPLRRKGMQAWKI